MISLLELLKLLPAIEKDGENPHFKSKYASLAGVRKAVDPILMKNGYYLTQELVEGGADDWYLLTVLKTAEPNEVVLSTRYPFHLDPNPQVEGSRLTYAKRYSIGLLLGLITEEDDDGNFAAEKADRKAEGGTSKGKPDKKAGILEDIKAEFAAHFTGDGEDMKKAKINVATFVFGSANWAKVEEMPVKELEFNLKRLKALFFMPANTLQNMAENKIMEVGL
jgi:hypothetical protein